MWSPKRITIAAVALIALIGIGVWQVAGGDTETGPSAGSSASSVSPDGIVTGGADVATPGLQAVSDDSDIGEPLARSSPASFEGSVDGVRAAAIAYLELTEKAVEMRPSDAALFAREIASARFADVFAADIEARMTELWATIPEGITLRSAPIETRVVADGDGWEVSVWFVEVITIGNEAVVDDWRTALYRLVWEDGLWKVDGFSSERGPMPGRGNSSASETPAGFEALLAGFDDEGLS